MIERGIDVSYETIRRWVDKFGSTYASRIKSRSEAPSPVWHLDEAYTKIDGKMVYLWRAVDDEGTVLDVVVQHRRNTKAATPFTPQTPKKPRGQTHQNRDGPTWVLWSRSETLRPETSSKRRRSQEQPRRMFACPHQKKRTKIPEISIC